MSKDNDPFSDTARYKHGALNTLHYKHPKYCYYKGDTNTIYKVLGYHWTINKYKIQSTKDYNKVLLVDPMSVLGVWDKGATEELKKQHG